MIAPATFNFGIIRMYELMRDRTPELVRVFHKADEALEWLELADTTSLDELHRKAAPRQEY